MSRNAIVAAVVMALFSHAAWAETGNVTIYGKVDMSVDSIDDGNGATTATQGVRTIKVSSNASRLGLKGAEDLGSGLSAIWQIEQTVNVDDSTTNANTLASRNSFVGLKDNDWGTVLLGRHDTPYKISTRKLDVFGERLADNRTLMGSVAGKSAKLAFDGRQGNILAYLSPELSGFSAALAYVAGAETATTSGQVKGSAWSVAGMYNKGSFYGALAYEVHDYGSLSTGTLAGGGAAGAFGGAGTKESAWKLGLGYKLDALTFGIAYEKSSDNFGGAGAAAPVAGCTAAGQDCYGHGAWYFSGKYAFGIDALNMAYGKVGNLAGTAAGGDTRASQFSVGYDHNLSKRTILYALYTSLSNGANINYGLASVSVTTGFTAATANGAKLTGVSLGLRHSF